MSAVTPDLVIGYDDRMAEILIRGIDEAVIEALRCEADARGTSIETEARRILTTAAGLDRVATARRLAQVRQRIGRLEGPSIVEDLRRDRDRDSAN